MGDEQNDRQGPESFFALHCPKPRLNPIARKSVAFALKASLQ